MTQKSMFKEIDVAIDKQIEEARNSGVFQSFADQLRSFSETEQKIINQFLSGLVVIIPVIALLGVFIFRTMKVSDLNTRKELESAIVSFKEGNVKLKAQEGPIVINDAIYEKSDFVNKLTDATSRLNLKANQINVDGFQKENLGGSINRIETSIMIDKFTNKAFVGLLNELHRKFKVIITEIDLEKTADGKFVSGKFLVEFYAKVN
ncbi:hypothetical protein ABMA70_04010 [Halobacteriovorax sp. XZX-3]|uniref:hypothetical protein n=1 Tax=unclassified Halobacteriovorax TaxID=2639665 RepID=UPI000CD1EDB1|nr:hypothetical protein [Halobacteriovorax sp. DA5]POB15328.1 hypothetical protein C0Z22_02770 [Halobacteriovorax sp. DA5]